MLSCGDSLATVGGPVVVVIPVRSPGGPSPSLFIFFLILFLFTTWPWAVESFPCPAIPLHSGRIGFLG